MNTEYFVFKNTQKNETYKENPKNVIYKQKNCLYGTINLFFINTKNMKLLLLLIQNRLFAAIFVCI